MSEISPRNFNPYAGCSEGALVTLDLFGLDPQYHLIGLAVARNMAFDFMCCVDVRQKLCEMAPGEKEVSLQAIKTVTNDLADMAAPQLESRIAIDSRAQYFRMNESGLRREGALAETILNWLADYDLPLREAWGTNRKGPLRPLREYFAMFRMMSEYPEGLSLDDLHHAIAPNSPPRNMEFEVGLQMRLGITVPSSTVQGNLILSDEWCQPVGELVEGIAAVDQSNAQLDNIQGKIEALASNPLRIAKLLRLGAESVGRRR